MTLELRVISIGTMASNPLWGEKAGASVRTGHATTTLIRSGNRTIIIDPGLPAPILTARLNERTGLTPDQVTHVFLTSFRPDVWRGIAAFDKATWWVAEGEREGMGVPLVKRAQEARAEGDEELAKALEQDIAVLKRCQAAPDRLADRVDLFPMHGVTPGLCGVLVAGPADGVGPGTTLVCGDAIPTFEHLQRGSVMHGAADVNQAMESFKEAIEIADMLVLGRDNLVVNPVRRGF